MNSSNESSFTISTQETPLLQNDPPTQPTIKNLRTKSFFLVRILLVLIAGFLILYTIYATNPKGPQPHSSYLSGLARYYCHLTPHHKLCYHSMSSTANATAIEFESDPALIFAASLQLVVNQLNRTATSIAKTLSLPASDASPSVPGLSACQALIGDSLSRLNRSLDLLGPDLFFMLDRNITDEIGAAQNNSAGCLAALDGGDVGVGVEEVKFGLEKARKLLVNFDSLFKWRVYVLNDFSNRFAYFEEERYNYLYNYYFYFNDFGYGFDYGFMVFLYGSMYVFVALLYFLFWQ